MKELIGVVTLHVLVPYPSVQDVWSVIVLQYYLWCLGKLFALGKSESENIVMKQWELCIMAY